MFSCLFSLISIVFMCVFCEFFPYCLFVSNSQVIACEDRLRNVLYIVSDGALNSTQSHPTDIFALLYFSLCHSANVYRLYVFYTVKVLVLEPSKILMPSYVAVNKNATEDGEV